MRIILLACVAWGAAAASTAAADPLDKPAFTATPAELLAAARLVPRGEHDVVILREDVTLTFDARGRAEHRTRLVFTIVAPGGVDGWGTLSLGWRPFYQDRPGVRARVIGPRGDVTELDASLVHDAPSVNESPTVFSDRRNLTAPLPRLAVGAVVEEEFLVKDREPLLAAGIVDWYGLPRVVPITRKVVVVSAPTALGARVIARGPALPVRPTTRRAGDRTIVTFDVRDVAPAADGVPAVPSDHLSSTFIGVGTGASWAAIAADYHRLVEDRLTKGVPLPPELRGPTPRATVERIVAWLHARVRYTGIELSDSAIIPFAPADTLARGFGDCKDKAALLVALLRAAGITANLALLSTGPGWDTDAELPGMGSFDHAIVRAVVDGKDLWIDATEDLLPAGQLPTRDQGRRALIIAADTRALAPTPKGGPAENRVHELRTFRLAEDAAARVSELTEQHGVYNDLRRWVGHTARKDLHDSLTSYVAAEYQGKLATFSHGDPHDLATPFTMSIEVAEAGRTGALREHLYAWLFATDAFERLPDTFTSDDAGVEKNVAERRVDYVWTVPHRYEIVNRLELPPGYSAPDLPARETRTFGTLTVTTTRTRTPGALTVTYRLDTGKPRITADELRATRAAVRKAFDEGGERIVLNLDAAILKGQGKMREAIAEYRRLIALHPKEALHHGQLAQAYLAAGLGEAARREARLATTIEPKSGDAWMVLGHLLDRDLIGRQWRPGSDRPGAEAAFRKALVHYPTHVGAKHALIALLTTDELGRPALDGPRLREAISVVRTLDADEDRDERLLGLLARAGDHAGLTELAGTLSDSQRRRVALVAATALRDGGEAALRKADSLTTTGDRTAVIDQVTTYLTMGRHYAPLIAIRRTLMTRASAQEKAVLDRLRVIDVDHLPPTDPTTPVLLAGARWVLGPLRDPPWGVETEAEMVDAATGAQDTLRGQQLQLPARVFLDFMAATLSPVSDGDARSGWRVSMTTPGGVLVHQVVMRKGRAFLLGAGHLPAGIGRDVLDAVKRRDLPAARALLVRFDDDNRRGLPPDLGGFLGRHRAELATAPAPLLELAGALLIADRAPAVAAPILRGCAGLTGDDDLAACRTQAAAAHAELRQWPQAIEQQRAHLAAAPGDIGASLRLASALQFAGKGAEAPAVLDRALAEHPDNVNLQIARAHAALPEGWPVARTYFDKMVAPADADRGALNDAAWTYLFHDPDPARARALIERVTSVMKPDPHEANTLAAVLAEGDEPFAAWERLEPTLADKHEPGPADWYVIGRIAEGYGLRDDAIAAYRRTARELPPSYWPPTEQDFVRRRLKLLGVPPRKP